MEDIRLKLEHPPSTFRLKVGDAPKVSTVITARDFVGPFYDWQTEELVDPWVNGCRESHGELVTYGYALTRFSPRPIASELGDRSDIFVSNDQP